MDEKERDIHLLLGHCSALLGIFWSKDGAELIPTIEDDVRKLINKYAPLTDDK